MPDAPDNVDTVDTVDLSDFELRLRRALHELVPDPADTPLATVRPLRRHRWVVGASVAALAAAAAAVVVAVLPGDDEPTATPPAGHPAVSSAPASSSAPAPTATCDRLAPQAGALRVTGADSAAMTVRLTSADGCVLRATPTIALDLGDQAHLSVTAASGASTKLPLTIPAGGSALVELPYRRVSTAGTSPRDWRLTVRVGTGRTGSTQVTFPLQPGYVPSRYVLQGVSS